MDTPQRSAAPTGQRRRGPARRNPDPSAAAPRGERRAACSRSRDTRALCGVGCNRSPSRHQRAMTRSCASRGLGAGWRLAEGEQAACLCVESNPIPGDRGKGTPMARHDSYQELVSQLPAEWRGALDDLAREGARRMLALRATSRRRWRCCSGKRFGASRRRPSPASRKCGRRSTTTGRGVTCPAGATPTYGRTASTSQSGSRATV